MVFVLSKVLWLLCRPSHLLLLLLILGTALLFSRAAAIGRTLVASVVAILLVLTFVSPGAWLIETLEQRFPIPSPMPDSVDGIIVLGGALAHRSSGMPDLSGAADRMTTFVTLAERYPAARLVYTGGSGALDPHGPQEAEMARQLLESVGFDTERVIFEDRSRNTHENAVFSKQLVRPAEGETWLLVTSAAHMPRSVGAFRQVGWPIIPYPVDFRIEHEVSWEWTIDLPGALGGLDTALREWTGLAAYHWLGYTDAFFPGPADDAMARD